jgi:hypothetical protein
VYVCMTYSMCVCGKVCEMYMTEHVYVYVCVCVCFSNVCMCMT